MPAFAMLFSIATLVGQSGGGTQQTHEAPEPAWPAALQRMLVTRQRIERADAYMSRAYPQLDREPVFLRLRLAGPDRGTIHLGTAAGMVSPDSDGRPRKARVMGLLQRPGDVWQYRLETAEADQYMHRPPIQVPCYSSLGLLPRIDAWQAPPEQTLHESLERLLGPDYRFDERAAGRLHRVEAVSRDGRNRIRWLLDPAQDDNPVRVELWQNDRLVASCTNQYERIGGLYVPVSTAYFNADGRLALLDTVHKIRVNDADLPARLRPEDIGVEPGATVYVHEPTGRVRRLRYLPGERLVTPEAFGRLLRRGDLTPGPVVRALRDGREPPLLSVDPHGNFRRLIEAQIRQQREAQYDPWYVYTQRFIERYRLDAEQRQKALTILRACQLEREHRLRSLGRKIRALRRALADTPDPASKRALAERLQRLEAPIKAIFEQKLKPRLERLPTRAQRRAAQESP